MMKRIGLNGKLPALAAADAKRDLKSAGAAMPAETISDRRVMLPILLSSLRGRAGLS
jgi:hypothetical protein